MKKLYFITLSSMLMAGNVLADDYIKSIKVNGLQRVEEETTDVLLS